MSADRAPRPPREIAVAVVEHEGQLLIGQREAGAALAGFWEFPGGKVETGESPQAAAVRECLEETGLLVRIEGSYGDARYEYAHDSVRLWFFACAIEKEERTLPARFRWIARSELTEYRFPPANAALLERLRKSC